MLSKLEIKKPINIFISYAQEDEALLHQLLTHLMMLRRQVEITLWYDSMIAPGEDLRTVAKLRLETADIILLLVSVDFLSSDYCYGPEMQRILEKQKAGTATVLPIIIRPADWRYAPFSNLQVLPSNGKPVTVWHDLDAALFDVVKGIRNSLTKILSPSPTASDRITETESVEPALPAIWNVPFLRKSYFVGREDLLKVIYETFLQNKVMSIGTPTVLVGPPGIGKTQLAIEYAYRYGRNYQGVLWANASSYEMLTSSFLSIAHILNVPQKKTPNQNIVLMSVKSWLENNSDWLLILDDVDDLAVTFDFLPKNANGDTLLLTGSRVTGTFTRVDVTETGIESSMLLLLQEANLIYPGTRMDTISSKDLVAAESIVQMLDKFPLALNQAGAYIRETGCSLSDYIAMYSNLSVEGFSISPFVSSISLVKTYMLTFTRITQNNPMLKDLLQVFAFFSPHAVPEDMIIDGASELGPNLATITYDRDTWDTVITELVKYSLLYRYINKKVLVMHAIIQNIIKNTMKDVNRCQWSERAVRALNKVFPDTIKEDLILCQKYLPHALTCSSLIEEWHMTFSEAGALLRKIASYFKQQKQYQESERFYIQALAIYEEKLGVTHPDTAMSLNNLAQLYHEQGRYHQAESFYTRALAIYEEKLGITDSIVATVLNNLAALYSDQAKYNKAETIQLRALYIDEKVLDPNSPNLARDFNNLGEILAAQGRLLEALSYYERALSIDRTVYGYSHPNVAVDLNNLASIYRNIGELSQAQYLYEQALLIDKETYGSEHPNVSIRLNNLGRVMFDQCKLLEAKELYEQALQIAARSYSPEHPNVGYIATNLGRVFHEMGDMVNAELYYKRAYAIFVNSLGVSHPYLKQIEENLSYIDGASR